MSNKCWAIWDFALVMWKGKECNNQFPKSDACLNFLPRKRNELTPSTKHKNIEQMTTKFVNQNLATKLSQCKIYVTLLLRLLKELSLLFNDQPNRGLTTEHEGMVSHTTRFRVNEILWRFIVDVYGNDKYSRNSKILFFCSLLQELL